jgi:hypothetical protein
MVVQGRSRKWGDQVGIFIAVASGIGIACGVVIADGPGIAFGAAIGSAAGVVIGAVYQLIRHP